MGYRAKKNYKNRVLLILSIILVVVSLHRILTTVTKDKCLHWIVLDDHTSPCDDVTTYTSQTNWSVVIVTDHYKHIEGCRLPKCHQLTWNYAQKEMKHFVTLHHLLKPSKLLGYLYAIENGAKVILDAECSSQVRDITATFQVNAVHQSGLWYNETGFFNPFHHYGLTDAFPIEMLHSDKYDSETNEFKQNEDKFYISEWNSVPIRQGVTISRNTCVKLSDAAINKQNVFSHGPLVSVGYPSLAPFSTGPTVFYEEVFMLLFIPPDTDLYVKNLFRTLWFYYCSKFSTLRSAFYFIQPNNDSLYDCSISEGPNTLSYSFKSISSCMNDFTCKQKVTCHAEILRELTICFEKEIYHEKQINVTSFHNAWEVDFLKLGLPTEVNTDSRSKTMFKIVYRIPRQVTQKRHLSSEKLELISKDVLSLCGANKSYARTSLEKIANPLIQDILLIIVLNYDNLFPSLGYNEFIHRQYFKYIVYCVPTLSKFDTFTKTAGFDYVTFIEGVASSWQFFYECAVAAMHLSLPVKGYLQIGDDVLLNSWNVVTLPRDGMMVHTKVTYVDLYNDDPDYWWPHWNYKFGQKAAQKAIAELKNASSLYEEEITLKYPLVNFSTFAAEFLTNLELNIKPNFVAHGINDIFYVPQSLTNEFITACQVFRKHNCMEEIALRTIALGLRKPNNPESFLTGQELWGLAREKPWEYFDATSDLFLHPFKWMDIARKTLAKRLACERYLPLLG